MVLLVLFLVAAWIVYAILAYSIIWKDRHATMRRIKDRNMWRTKLFINLFGLSFILYSAAMVTMILGLLECPPLVSWDSAILNLADTITEYGLLIIMAPMIVLWLLFELFGALFLGKEFAGGGLK